MTADPSLVDAAARSADLALARLHLRLGSLALARAELEALAGADALDHDGVLDLIEARWRTGDLVGAGEAADLVLDGGDGPLIALIVAAETAVRGGRPTEGRRLAERAIAAAGPTLDAVFAGMPRGSIWPADATDQPPTTPTLFDPPDASTGPASGLRPAHPAPAAVAAAAAVTAPAVRPEPETLALWEAPEPIPDAAAEPLGADEPAIASPPEPRTESGADPLIAAARAALERDDIAAAAAALGLALRTDPTHADAVLAAIDGHDHPGLALVRGDAYRLVGREADARIAFDQAARALDPSNHPPDPEPPEGDPA